MFLPCLLVRLLTTTPGIIASAIVTLTIGAANECVSEDGSAVSERSFRFTYNVTIRGLSVDDQVRVWIPEPAEDPYQSVELVSRNLPARHSQQRGKKYGNRWSYFSATVRFVYPHVEVNGEAWPRDRVETEFTSNSE